MMGSIGLTVGFLGFLLFFLIEVLASVKYHVVRCRHPSILLWLAFVSYRAAAAAAATMPWLDYEAT